MLVGALARENYRIRLIECRMSYILVIRNNLPRILDAHYSTKKGKWGGALQTPPGVRVQSLKLPLILPAHRSLHALVRIFVVTRAKVGSLTKDAPAMAKGEACMLLYVFLQSQGRSMS